MEISTSAFQFAHGKRPRGVGQWAFEITYLKNGPGTLTREVFFAPAMLGYGEAKKWAIKKSRELGAVHLAVAS